jgi:hypothetical protein
MSGSELKNGMFCKPGRTIVCPLFWSAFVSCVYKYFGSAFAVLPNLFIELPFWVFLQWLMITHLGRIVMAGDSPKALAAVF